ncbi:MAG: flagellin [Polyangiales bacterium]
MPLYIQTNTASMVAQNSLSKTQGMLSSSFQRLSSGYRINSAADDAAGLGISKSMEAQVRSFAVAERNANDGISMAQTADGAAEQVHGILGRLRELAVQGANGTLSTNDSQNLNTEFQALLGEVDRIANVITFNGQNLLDAVGTVTYQVGINNSADNVISVTFGGANVSALGLSLVSVSTVADAQGALNTIDTAIQTLAQVRTRFGTAMNRLQGAVANLQSLQTNLSASLSRIRDADIAQETSALARNQVLSQAGASILSQANQAPQLALSLLRGG